MDTRGRFNPYQNATHTMNPTVKKVLKFVVIVLVGVVLAERIRALPVVGDKIPSL